MTDAEPNDDRRAAAKAARKAKFAAAMQAAPPSPSRTSTQLVNAAVVGAAAVIAIEVFARWQWIRDWSATPPDGAARDHLLIGLSSLAAAAVSVGTVLYAWARPGRVLPPSSWSLVLASLAAPVAVFFARVGLFAAFDATAWWASRPGLKCFNLSSEIGLVFFVALFFTRRSTDPRHLDAPWWRQPQHAAGLALGMAAGSLGAVFADLWCPVGHPLHVLIGHVGPMCLFGLLGATLGAWVLTWRAR